MPETRLRSVQHSLRFSLRSAAAKNTYLAGRPAGCGVRLCVCVCLCLRVSMLVVLICKAAGSSGRGLGSMQMREAGLLWGSASLPRSWGQRCQAQLDQRQQLGE